MVTRPGDDLNTTSLRVRRVAAAKVGLHHMRCDDARSDDRRTYITAWHCARNVEALPGFLRRDERDTEFGIPADHAASLLGGYVPAVSGRNFGRRGGWTFLDFLRTLVIIAIYPCH